MSRITITESQDRAVEINENSTWAQRMINEMAAGMGAGCSSMLRI